MEKYKNETILSLVRINIALYSFSVFNMIMVYTVYDNLGNLNLIQHICLFFIFRNGYCILSMENISGGVYNIIPSTFLPAKEGHFILKFSSSCPMTVSKLR